MEVAQVAAYHCGKGLQHIQQGDAVDEAVKGVHLSANCCHSPLQDLQGKNKLRLCVVHATSLQSVEHG